MSKRKANSINKKTMAWRVPPTPDSFHSTEQICSSYELQEYSGRCCLKCFSFGFKVNSHLCQELVDNSCGIIIIDCAVTLENRLESEKHSFWPWNLWRQPQWLTQEFFWLLHFCFVLFCFTFIFFFFKLFSFFFFNLKEQVLLELLGLLQDRLVTRHSVFKSVLQQDYLEGDRIY